MNSATYVNLSAIFYENFPAILPALFQSRSLAVGRRRYYHSARQTTRLTAAHSGPWLWPADLFDSGPEFLPLVEVSDPGVFAIGCRIDHQDVFLPYYPSTTERFRRLFSIKSQYRSSLFVIRQLNRIVWLWRSRCIAYASGPGAVRHHDAGERGGPAASGAHLRLRRAGPGPLRLGRGARLRLQLRRQLLQRYGREPGW